MRVLVIGANGFVGSHLTASIWRVCGEGVEIVRTARVASPGCAALDLTDMAAVRATLDRTRPTHIINLAGIAAPALAARAPDAAWALHCDAVRRLGATMLEIVPDSILVNVGTGLVYGASFASGAPLDEDAVLRPLDDYAASKAAGDLALGVLARRGLKSVLMRPFNHIGPGQTEDFALPSFAAQIARIEAGQVQPVLHVGNLEAERDFVDVRDVCDAYAAALLAPDTLQPGTVLNLASGRPRKMAEVLDGLLSLSGAAIRVDQDPQRMRASDVPRVVGDAGRAHAALGWVQKISFGETLRSVLTEWRARVRTVPFSSN